MNPKLATVVLAAFVLVAGASTVAATSSGDQAVDEEVRIVDEEVTISDAVVTVSDTTITGPFDSDGEIEDQRYTVDSTVRLDGLHVTYDGTRYTFCRIVVHVEDVGLHVQDVNVESTE